MTYANWGGPGAGYPGTHQTRQTYSQGHEPQAQDPAWHGQPPVTRPQQPQMHAQPQMQPQARHPQPQHVAQPQVHQQQGYYPQQAQPAPAQPRPQPQAPYQQQAYHAAPQPQGYPAQGGYPVQGGYPQEPRAPAMPPAAADPGGMASVMNGLGAVVSIALICGLAVWGYKLAMRDVTEVPVIAALEGPMRVQPDNPGGEAAAHQGLAVNNIAAEGVAEGPTDQVVLAPPAESLEEADLPQAAEARIEAARESGPAEPDATLGTQPIEVAASAEDAEAATLALVEQISAGSKPLSGEEADLSMTPEAEERALDAARAGNLVQPSVPGVARSPRPEPRPGDLVTRASARPSSDALLAAAQEAVREIDPSQIAAGTRLVQLGAFDTEDVARSEWDRLNGRFGEYLEGKSRVIEKAQSGGKTFYRLRAMGFDDLSEARRLCAALMAGNASCIPVVTR